MYAFLAIAAAISLGPGAPSCWDLAYGAIRHSAAAAHPHIVRYDATGTVSVDGHSEHRQQSVVYRDDGVALVTDDRFVHAYTTRSIEPGPPVIGPFQGRRANWLLPDDTDTSLHVVATVHTHRPPCTNARIVHYAGHDAYDLVIGAPDSKKAGIHEMLVDVNTGQMWKVALRSYAMPSGSASSSPVSIDYAIELQQSGSYLVVRHINWQYTVKDDSQWSNVAGEYYYSDFRFVN